MPKLTTKAIESLSTPGRYADGDGLYIEVTSTGSKRWLFRYQFRGKRTQLGLGAFSKSNSLAIARQNVYQLNGLIAKGIDPKDHKDEQAEKTKAKELLKKQELNAKQNTFEKVATDWWNNYKAGWSNSKHADQNINTLRQYAFPVFGDKPVKDISVRDIQKCLGPIWETKTETASRLRQRIERVLNYAKSSGLRSGENPAQWKNNLDAIFPPAARLKKNKALLDPNQGHFSAMDYEKIPEFYEELSGRDALSARMLQFTILTVMRTTSVLEAKWDQIDMKKSIWSIPAAQMKTKKAFVVALSREAKAILKSIPKVSEYIFPSPRDLARPMSNNAMLSFLKKYMGYSDYTVHGFRTGFRTWAAEATQFGGDLAEHALAHEVGSAVERAYQRSDLLKKRVRMMDEWARFLAEGTK